MGMQMACGAAGPVFLSLSSVLLEEVRESGFGTLSPIMHKDLLKIA